MRSRLVSDGARRVLFAAVVLTAWLGGCGPARPTYPAPGVLGFERLGTDVAPLWSRWGSAGPLRYLELVVGTDEAGGPLPVVVALHGYADAPRVPAGPFLARARPYRLVMPEGPVQLDVGRAWSTHRVLDGRPDALAHDLVADVPLVLAVLDAVARTRPMRGRPVLSGFSQGGHLALVLATRHPERFARAIPMAGWMPPSLVPARSPARLTPIRGVHARDDERVPLGPTRALYDELSRLGWDASLEIVEGGHAPSAALEAFFARELDAALIELAP